MPPVGSHSHADSNALGWVTAFGGPNRLPHAHDVSGRTPVEPMAGLSPVVTTRDPQESTMLETQTGRAFACCAATLHGTPHETASSGISS